jgi:lipopolysaccharide export system protein LptA
MAPDATRKVGRTLTVPPPAALALALSAAVACAQQPAVAVIYPDLQHPVAIDADNLSVSDADGIAIFSGHVVMTQRGVRMQCSRVLFRYRRPGSHDRNVVGRLECEPPIVHLISDP